MPYRSIAVFGMSVLGIDEEVCQPPAYCNSEEAGNAGQNR